MPKVIEDKLKKEANKEGIKGKDKDAYVYGTLSKLKKKANKDTAVNAYMKK